MRAQPITVVCPKCGTKKETASVTSTRCRACRYLIYVGAPKPDNSFEKKKVVCKKCGHRQQTKAETGWICGECGAFHDLRPPRKSRKQKSVCFPVRGSLAGYCSGCGLMLMKGQRGRCVRCGGTGVTDTAPPPAEKMEAPGVVW